MGIWDRGDGVLVGSLVGYNITIIPWRLVRYGGYWIAYYDLSTPARIYIDNILGQKLFCV